MRQSIMTVTALAALGAMVATAQAENQSTRPAQTVSAAAASGGIIRLHNAHGGLITAYRNRFIQAKNNGERVVIDGMCLSACTMAVGILPPGRVCVTPQAVLGFQSAWRPGWAFLWKDPAPTATQLMMNTYPPKLQQWINQHGGLTPKLILLRGKELAAIVPKCRGSG
jgi:hypothetical protein